MKNDVQSEANEELRTAAVIVTFMRSTPWRELVSLTIQAWGPTGALRIFLHPQLKILEFVVPCEVVDKWIGIWQKHPRMISVGVRVEDEHRGVVKPKAMTASA